MLYSQILNNHDVLKTLSADV